VGAVVGGLAVVALVVVVAGLAVVPAAGPVSVVGGHAAY